MHTQLFSCPHVPLAESSIVTKLYGYLAPCKTTLCMRDGIFFLLSETLAFSWQHGVNFPSLKLSTCFLVTWTGCGEGGCYAGWIWCSQELTTGRTSGMIFQPLIVVPFVGMSKVIMSDSNSTSWWGPGRTPSLLYLSPMTLLMNDIILYWCYIEIELTVRCASTFHVTTKWISRSGTSWLKYM